MWTHLEMFSVKTHCLLLQSHASRTENFLGMKNLLTPGVVSDALDILWKETNPVDATPGPSTQYKHLVVVTLLYKVKRHTIQ